MNEILNAARDIRSGSSVRKYLEAPFKDDKTVQEVGIGGFTTLVRVTETIRMTAVVPTSYVETGAHVNDHIQRGPVFLDISGSVSDVFVTRSPFNKIVNDLQNTIGQVTQFLPGRTAAQISKLSRIANDISDATDFADSVLNAGKNISGYFGSSASNSTSNQQMFMDHMNSLYDGDVLFSVQMPFKTYDRMVITALDFSFDNQTNETNFSVTMQQFRFADTLVEVVAKAPTRATDGSVDDEVDKGVKEPPEVNKSLLTSLKETILELKDIW